MAMIHKLVGGLSTATKLLLHFDEVVDGSLDIGDSGAVGHIITPAGTAALSTAAYKFGSCSLFLDGDSDYVTIPDSTSWDIFDGNDWTLEFWVKHDDASVSHSWVHQYQDATHQWVFYYTSGSTIQMYVNEGTGPMTVVTSSTYSLTTWTHLAFVKDGTACAIYVNGKQDGTGTISDNTTFAGSLTIGRNAGGSEYTDGNIDELRVSSVARYTSGASFVVDSGPVGHTPTLVGTAQLSTAQSKFGSCSLLLDGDSDWVSFPDSASWDIAGATTGSYTVDFWARQTTDDNALKFFFEHEDTSGGQATMQCYIYQKSLRFIVVDSGGTEQCGIRATADDFDDTNWHHVAVIRVNNNVAVYADGVRVGSDTLDTAVTYDGLFRIGVFYNYGSIANYWAGNIDEFRVIAGNPFNADPTSSNPIIVPTVPHKSDDNGTKLLLHFDIQHKEFESDANTKLLLHFNSYDYSGDGGSGTYKVHDTVGTAQVDIAADTIVDYGVTGHSITVVGTAAVSTATSAIGEGCLVLDGDSDYLTVPDHADWTIGTGNFTIDAWVNFSTTANIMAIYDQYVDENNWNSLYVHHSANLLAWYGFRSTGGGDTYVTCSWDPSINTWYHIALVRDGSTSYKMFIDGVSQSVTVTTPDLTDYTNLAADLKIGLYSDTTQYYSGYIDEFRISNTARWTANFTPNYNKYYASDANTKLLLHFTAHKALSVDGDSDYVKFDDNADWDIGTNHTLECWIKSSTTNGTRRIISQGAGDSNNTPGWSFYLNTDSKLVYNMIDNTAGNKIVEIVSDASHSWSAWHHIAMEKIGNDYYLFRDGVIIGSGNDTSTPITSSETLRIGTGWEAAACFFSGLIDEVRISNIAMYSTAGFDIIAAPLSGIVSANNISFAVPSPVLLFDFITAPTYINIASQVRQPSILFDNVVSVSSVALTLSTRAVTIQNIDWTSFPDAVPMTFAVPDPSLSIEGGTTVAVSAVELVLSAQGVTGFPTTYHITNFAELQAMASDLNGDYILDNDIDLTGETYTPVGTVTTPFTGSFDGQDYVLSNLTMNVTGGTAGYGLFGAIQGATIHNLILDNWDVNVTASVTFSNYGTLVGVAKNSSGTYDNIIYECGVTSLDLDIVSSVASGTITAQIGGLIGYGEFINFDDCYVTGTIDLTSSSSDTAGKYFVNIGGFIGGIDAYADFDSCNTNIPISVTAQGTASKTYGVDIGGFYGTHITENTLIYLSMNTCFALGDITATNLYSQNIGGLGGALWLGNTGVATISNCYAELDVNVTGRDLAYFGGLCTDIRSTWDSFSVTGCHYTGKLTFDGSSGSYYLGGLVGESYGVSYYTSYSSGTMEFSALSSINYLGGFIGECYCSDSTVELDACYSDMDILITTCSLAEEVGGFIGKVTDGGLGDNQIITDCYSIGNITITSVANVFNIGGFIGRVDDLTTGYIMRNYYEGTMTLSCGTDYYHIGGFIGDLSLFSNSSNSAYIKDNYTQGSLVITQS